MKKSVTIKAAWITAGAIICAAIITGLFSLGNQEEQVFQTGDTNVYSKDHVEGDKIVNVGPSDDDLERIVSKAAEKLYQSLSRKYPEGHTVFGIKKDGLVVPKGVVLRGVDIAWNTGKVLSVSGNEVKVLLPDMVINTDQFKNLKINGNKVVFDKRVMNVSKPFFVFGKLNIGVEVIGMDKDLVIVGLGIYNR